MREEMGSTRRKEEGDERGREKGGEGEGREENKRKKKERPKEEISIHFAAREISAARRLNIFILC